MIFPPEHVKDISYVYVVDQKCKSVSDLFAEQTSKRISPYLWHYFVCISSSSVDKKIILLFFYR